MSSGFEIVATSARNRCIAGFIFDGIYVPHASPLFVRPLRG